MIQVKQYQARVGLQAQQPVQSVAADSGIGEMSRGLASVGQLMFDVRDEIDTADAMVADTKYNSLINDLLYNEQSGYMYSQGGDAIARRESVAKQLNDAKEKALKDLTVGARAHAMRAMSKRAEDTIAGVNQHAAAQSREYLNQASSASLQMFASDAVYKPDEANISIKRMDAVLNDLAARNGWPPEQLALEKAKASSKVHSDIATRLYQTSPMAALDYVRNNKGAMQGEDVARLEQILAPAVKGEQGRNLGAAAAGPTGYTYSTQIDYSMGPKRPYKPNQPVIDVVGMAAEDVLGKGARVIITSGQEGDKPQHGSRRHGTGDAADVAFIRPDGSRVGVNDPEAVLLAQAAARLGAKGIGFGAEYMGDHFHIDLVEPQSGEGHFWASGAKANSQAIMQAMSEFKGFGSGGINDLINIPDPEVRQAALAEYELRQKVRSAEQSAMMEAAQTAAFEMVLTGGNINELPVEQQSALGIEAMNKLRSYQESMGQSKVQTDPVAYAQLYELSASNPQAFLAMDLTQYLDRLGMTEFKEIVKLRESVRSGDSSGGKANLPAMRQMASPYLVAAGIDSNSKKGAEQFANIEMNYIKWYSQRAVEGRPPSELEIADWLKSRISTSVRYDPRGIGDYGGSVGGFDYSKIKSVDDLLDKNVLTMGGKNVPREDIVAARAAFIRVNGIEPTPYEVIEILTDTRE